MRWRRRRRRYWPGWSRPRSRRCRRWPSRAGIRSRRRSCRRSGSIVPAVASARSCCQTAGPAAPSVFMLCCDSNAMTAPVVMTLAEPVLHRLVNERRLAPTPAERARLGLSRLLWRGQRTGRREGDRQVPELGQQLLEPERAAVGHGELEGGARRQVPPRRARHPSGTTRHGHRLGRRRHQGRGGHERIGVRGDHLPVAGDGGGQRGSGGVGAEGLGELHGDGCVARHLGRAVDGGLRNHAERAPVGRHTDFGGRRRGRRGDGPAGIPPDGHRGTDDAHDGDRHQGDGDHPSPVSRGGCFWARTPLR